VSRPDAAVAARALTGARIEEASVDARSPVTYDPYLPGRSVERMSGTGTTADGRRTAWSAIAKRTEGPGLRAARRELTAYRMGIAGPDGEGLGAPRLLAWLDEPTSVELWLEVLADVDDGHWAMPRFAQAAAHIATWDAWTSERPVPTRFDSEDAWAERHGRPERVDEALAELASLRGMRAAPAIMRLLDDAGFRRTRALIEGTQARIDRLAQFPRSLLHHDLVRSNLFALPGGGIAAIDWENVGRGPLGVDLCPLVIGSVRRGEASGEDLEALELACLDAYVTSLGAAGVHRERDVREAYDLAIGLRWHVVLGAIRTWLDPGVTRIRGSRPDEPRDVSLPHLVAVARHILERGGV
jgi:hypothetical protein